jgi:hypothetical protein
MTSVVGCHYARLRGNILQAKDLYLKDRLKNGLYHRAKGLENIVGKKAFYTWMFFHPDFLTFCKRLWARRVGSGMRYKDVFKTSSRAVFKLIMCPGDT